jgi:hypothetical protein
MSARILALVVIAALPASAGWEANASPGFAFTGDSNGPAASTSVLYRMNDWFAAGVAFDFARLSASGLTPSFASIPSIDGPYRYAIASTLAGAMIEVRFPLGRFAPSIDLAAGWNEVRTLYAVNTQCGIGSGFSARLGAAVGLAATERFSIGVRGSVQPLGASSWCPAMLGPHMLDLGNVWSLGPTVSLRF